MSLAIFAYSQKIKKPRTPKRQPWLYHPLITSGQSSFYRGTASDCPSHFAGVLLGRLLLGSV